MHCPLCDEKSIRLVDERRHVYACAACTHEFTVLPAELQEPYDEDYFFIAHKNWFQHPDFHFFQRVMQTFEALPSPKVSICDIGCGNGDLLYYLHAKKPQWDLTGIDLIKNDHPQIHFIQGDIYTTPLGKTFDGVCCLHTIEHVVDPNQLVRIFSSTLAPDGLLLVATIDSSSLVHRIARILKSIGIRVAYDRIFSSHHLHHFSFQSLRSLLERHNFEVTEHFNYNHPLRAVDVPAQGVIGTVVYKSIVWVLFSFLALQRKGMLQAIVCRKKQGTPSAA